MIGLWRGPIVLQDGRKGIAEFSFCPHFEGNLIELVALSIDAETGESQAWGMAHLALDRAGRTVWRQFNQRIGFATLNEVDDDPGVLSASGSLSAGRQMMISIRQDGDELAVTVSSGMPDGPKTVSRMRRASRTLRERP